jgi:Na+/melibiose symporter-like transporter
MAAGTPEGGDAVTAGTLEAPRLGFFPKLWYGVGQSAEGLKNSSFAVFLLLYYSQVLGLNPALAGTALLLSLVFDAVTDPLTGSISDSWRSRWGRRHGFMYASALPLAITFYFVWNPPDGLQSWGLFAWMTTWTILARGAMTLYHVPHLALGAELSNDYAERTRVVAFRIFFGFVGAGTMFVLSRAIFMRPTLEFDNGQLNPAAYSPLGLWFGIAIAAIILISALGTHRRIPYLPKPPHDLPRFSAGRLWGELVEAIENPSFRTFFFGLMLYYVARGLELGLGLYMGTFFWKLGSAAVTVPIAGLLGVMAGSPVFAVLGKRIEKKPMFMTGIIGFSTFTMLLPISKLVGLFPPESSPIYVPTIYLFAFVAAFLGAAGLISAGSMLADIADEHELKTGRRQEGIFFGALSFSGKASGGIGSWIAGLALVAIHFPVQTAVGDVDPWTITQLALIYGPGVFLLVATSIVIVSRYSLTRERHAEIRKELDARKERLEGAQETEPAVAASGT